MDEIVLRAIAKWPNVPSVYNWLALDRRGNWLVKGERIGNPAVVDFIGRNYAGDDHGRWFFQNGPQRVFVDLAYTPMIYRLQPQGQVSAHTGASAHEAKAAWVDEHGDFLLETELGIGLVSDRDLPILVDHLRQGPDEPADDQTLEALVHRTSAPALRLALASQSVALNRIRSDTLPARFHFDPRPRPAPGEPEC
jgi:hypothetical protein